MKMSTVLNLNGKEIEIRKRSSDVKWADRIYARIHQEREDCYLDITEVRELLKEMEELL